MSVSRARMNLSPAERGWLPWFGKTGRLAMGWACWVNRGMTAELEQTFEGIAQTRLKNLQQWSEAHWARLGELSQGMAATWPTPDTHLLREALRQLPDCSELFVLDAGGEVLASSCDTRQGERVVSEHALA